MRTNAVKLAAVVLSVFMGASVAQGTVWFEFIDKGVPTDGVHTMHGWRGVVVRARSDEGPILRIDFGTYSGNFGVFGAIAQRWTDPNGTGDYFHEAGRSPGPMTFDNTTPSEFNFDSHFLGGPGDYTSITSFNGATWLDTPYEAQMLDHFFIDRTGIPSTPFVGYGAALPWPVWPDDDPIHLVAGGHLVGDFEIAPVAQSESIDIAYVVTDSTFGVSGVFHTSAVNTYAFQYYTIPEPGAFLVMSAAWCGLLRRRRGCRIEPLNKHVNVN